MKENAKICIEDSPGIGDLIMLTPALRAIKLKYPKSKLTILSTNPYSLHVVERLPYVDAVYPVMSSNKLGLLKIISRQDYLICRSYQPLLYWIAFLCRVPYRIGPCKDKYKKYRLLTKYYPYGKAEPNIFEAQYFKEKIERDLGVELPFYLQCDVSFPKQEEKISAMHKLMREAGKKLEKYIVIVPFGNSDIPLPQDKLEAILHYLSSQGWTSVIVDGKKHKEIEKYSIDNTVLNLCGKTTLMEMVAIIQDSAAVVSIPTGPLHIACALKKRTLGIFTNGTKNQWSPRTYCYPVGLDLPCMPCKVNGYRNCQDRKCMKDLSINMILQRLKIMLEEI